MSSSSFLSFSSIFETEFSPLRSLPQQYWYIVGASIIFHSFIYLISDWLLPNRALLHKTCTRAELKDLKSRVVSNVHALYATTAAFYLLATDGTLLKMDVSYGCDTITLAFAVSAGYFIYDWLLIMTDYAALGGIGMMAHHLVALVAQVSTSYYQQFQLLIVLFAVTEITTPFVNSRLLLLKLNMKDGKLYVLNGLAMCIGFVVFRFSLVLLSPYLLITQRHVLANMAPALVVMAVVGQGVLGVLNTMWTYKIVSGLAKLVMTPAAGAAATTTSGKKKKMN